MLRRQESNGCGRGVAVGAVMDQLLAGLVLGTATALTVSGAVFAPATVVPTATSAPSTERPHTATEGSHPPAEGP